MKESHSLSVHGCKSGISRYGKQNKKSGQVSRPNPMVCFQYEARIARREHKKDHANHLKLGISTPENPRYCLSKHPSVWASHLESTQQATRSTRILTNSISFAWPPSLAVILMEHAMAGEQGDYPETGAETETETETEQKHETLLSKTLRRCQCL